MSTPREPLNLSFTPPARPTDVIERTYAELVRFLRDEIMPGLDEVKALWDTAQNGHVMDAVTLGRRASQLRMRIDTELPKAQWLLDVTHAKELGGAYGGNKIAGASHKGAGLPAKIYEAEAKAEIAHIQQLVSLLRNHQGGLIKDANFAQTIVNAYRDRITQTSLDENS